MEQCKLGMNHNRYDKIIIDKNNDQRRIEQSRIK